MNISRCFNSVNNTYEFGISLTRLEMGGIHSRIFNTVTDKLADEVLKEMSGGIKFNRRALIKRVWRQIEKKLDET